MARATGLDSLVLIADTPGSDHEAVEPGGGVRPQYPGGEGEVGEAEPAPVDGGHAQRGGGAVAEPAGERAADPQVQVTGGDGVHGDRVAAQAGQAAADGAEVECAGQGTG